MRWIVFVWMAVLSVAVGAQEPLLVSADTLPATKSVLVFGQRIVYYELGTGPTLVLVHGFASQANFDWGNVMTPLAEHYHVIAMDQIGFGASAKPVVDYSIQTYVDFLGEFLRELGVKRFTLVGESLGGWISAAYTIEALGPGNSGVYALAVPERLILEDAAGHSWIGGSGGGSMTIPIAGSLKEAEGVAIVFHDKSRVTEAFVRENFARKLAAGDGGTERSLWGNPKLVSELVGDKLERITIPTLVVWGGDDEIVPLAEGRDYAAKIAGAKLVIVPECGHAPSIEKPAAFLAAVEAFAK
jgi:pimeloyl-ACP methyl ester carboxylesterase